MQTDEFKSMLKSLKIFLAILFISMIYSTSTYATDREIGDYVDQSLAKCKLRNN